MTDTPPSSDDLAHADIGIVSALPIELGEFLDRCNKVKKYTGGEFVFRGGRYDGIRMAIVECGTGFARARRGTQSLIEAHTPRWILSCGFSGALLAEMKVGDIVVADSVVDIHGHELTLDMHLPDDRPHGLYVGRCVTTDELIRKVSDKQALADQLGAIAVDMESLAVAQVAKEHKLRYMCVRSISDDMSSDLPPEVLSLMASTGTMRLGAAMGAFWKRPGSVKDMWRLREQAQLAAERLATFLHGVVHQLHAASK